MEDNSKKQMREILKMRRVLGIPEDPVEKEVLAALEAGTQWGKEHRVDIEGLKEKYKTLIDQINQWERQHALK